MLDGIRDRLERGRGPADEAWDLMRRAGTGAVVDALSLETR